MQLGIWNFTHFEINSFETSHCWNWSTRFILIKCTISHLVEGGNGRAWGTRDANGWVVVHQTSGSFVLLPLRGVEGI
jgi:hypothetical protein